MREIKFRAWDVATKEMFPEAVNDDLLVKFFREVNERGTHATVMQYTGLHDCKGTPIYEGDIVKYKSTEEWGIAEITTMPGSFVFDWYEQHTSIPSMLDPASYFGCASELEVIGNIHQHPDLIRKD